MKSRVESTYSDEEVTFLVQRIQQGCKLLAVYVSRAKDLGRHYASSVEHEKRVEVMDLLFPLCAERGSSGKKNSILIFERRKRQCK